MATPAPPAPARAARPWLVVALVGAALVALLLIGLGLSMRGEPSATPAASTVPTDAVPSSPATSGSPGPGASATGSPAPTDPATPTSSAIPTGASAVPTTSPSDDPIIAGMLQAEDLPGMSDPLGVQEGTDFDIDEQAFEAHEGIRVTSRTWQSLADTGISAVFDFRMQLPSDEAAAAYLSDAEATLAETATTDQAPIPSPPIIGEDGRVYGLETTTDAGSVLLRTYLFRVGPVAAKVVVGGPNVTPAQADAVAQAAVRRMEAAGTPVPGSPRPPATPSPAPSATAPLPTGDLSALLLAHVPTALAAACVADDQRLWQGELATLVCTDVDQGVTVTYSGFADVESLQAAFAASYDSLGLTEVAASCDLGPYVGAYEVDSERVGDIACWSEPTGQAIMWSDERLAILSVAVTRSLDPAGLYLWWLEAGPEL